MSELIPDAEAVMVAWAKADVGLLALHAGRVASRLPRENTELQFPFLRVVRIAGGRSATEAPLDTALLQWDAYAGRTENQPDFAKASRIARTLVASAAQVRGLVVGDAFVYGFSRFVGPRRVDEPETGWARFQLDCHVTFRAHN